MISVEISKSVFNAVYLPLLDCISRYLVLMGGAGGGKSDFIAARYIYRLLNNKQCNLLVVRAVGVSNRDSTFALMKQIIRRWGVSELFKVNESDLRITCKANKNAALFKGLDDTEKLKSITFEKGELTDIWIEEASETLEADFNQLDLRLRGGAAKKQITISFNPIDVNHWLKKRFFDKKDPDVTTLRTTYKDNRFLDDDYRRLLESYKDTDPYYYTVYCLGEWGVYGKTIFDAQKVSERISQLKEQSYKQGYFDYQYDGLHITDIRWADDDDGYIKIFDEPRQGRPYVIGGDTAGEGSDSFTGQVLDNTTGAQVATLKREFDEDVYARAMYCLGTYYNNALIAPETNFSTYPTKELQRLEYDNLFVRVSEDNYTHKPEKRFGFQTNKQTRPIIIAALVEVVREHTELINDAATLDEMLTFVRNEKGRPEAQAGAHDDLIMGLAIAHYAREQQSYLEEKARPSRVVWRKDMIEDYWNASQKDREMLIAMWGTPENL